jgi:sugar O-acyltransferase (sialic acid O-acetyltransferase NeuD family)
MSGHLAVTRAVLWGATGHAKVLRECLHHAGVEIVAVCDRDPSVTSPFAEVPMLTGDDAFDDWLQRENPRSLGFLVAIGGNRGRDRIERHEFLARRGLVALRAVHPTAFVAIGAFLGEGAQVLAQSAVCVDASLGRSCIVNTGAAVDHECDLGDGVHIGPGARLAGHVRVGARAMIGMGAVVLPRIRIGEDAVVGAGAVVVKDVPPATVVVGNPAREIRKVEGIE